LRQRLSLLDAGIEAIPKSAPNHVSFLFQNDAKNQSQTPHGDS
jgi:hypothetical protein